jgi:hypothetical protein
MLVASAISWRPDICRLHNIGVQWKFPWHRTSDDEHSVLRSTGVLPANGMYRHTAYGTVWSPPASGVDRSH